MNTNLIDFLAVNQVLKLAQAKNKMWRKPDGVQEYNFSL